jgi:hypothetical protein
VAALADVPVIMPTRWAERIILARDGKVEVEIFVAAQTVLCFQ